MYIVPNYSIAVVFTIITMLCWGSWANTQKLAGKTWRFELFYWDYVIGILLTSLLFAFTLGSIGDHGRSFITDWQQADSVNLINAFIGGVIFNLANILLAAAISIAGMSIAFPVGIGLALVLGVVINYIYTPLGNPVFLFVGVTLIVFAILLDAVAYRKQAGDQQKPVAKGLLISIAAGLLMSFFYRFVAKSITTDFMFPEPGKLTPYTALVFFSLGIFLSNFLINSFFMYRPVAGKAVSYSQYFLGKSKIHLVGILGGFIWCIGMSLSIIAAGKAGYAISYGLGQGATLVAALWGVFIWHEFKNASKSTSYLLGLMFILFVTGLSVIVYAGVQ